MHARSLSLICLHGPQRSFGVLHVHVEEPVCFISVRCVCTACRALRRAPTLRQRRSGGDSREHPSVFTLPKLDCNVLHMADHGPDSQSEQTGKAIVKTIKSATLHVVNTRTQTAPFAISSYTSSGRLRQSS